MDKLDEKLSISTKRKSVEEGRNNNYGTDCTNDKDTESMEKEIPYPKSVFFIIVNEFCERFSYYGMKAVLTLYLTNVLLYNDDKATVVYHIFSGFCYFTPLFGAMIADSLLGKFRTILYLSIVYACGNIILSLAATPPLYLPTEAFSILGLALIAIGTGGIKPCVSAFGGDQFIIPQQEKQLSTFFSIFYFSINAGSLISTFITPIFRKDVSCFGNKDCYALAFSVPAGLMVTALVIFVIGKPWYTIKKAEGNIVMQVSKCIAHAIGRKRSSKAVRDHWLDHADDLYERKLIEDIKIVIRVLILYIPLPFFWALFDQQGSRWTLQATRMDGEVFGSWLIKPDQMQVINPFLILALIPLFDQIIYPGLAKVNLLKKPLQRLTFGGILAGVAFIISGLVELKLEATYAVKLSETESHLNFVNTLPCSLNLMINPELNSTTLGSLENVLFKQVNAGDYSGTVQVDNSTLECQAYKQASFKFNAAAMEASTFVIAFENGLVTVIKDKLRDELEKSKEGNPKLKMVISGSIEDAQLNSSLLLINSEGKVSKTLNLLLNVSTTFDTEPGEYKMKLVTPANETLSRLENSVNVSGILNPRFGGNYVFTLMKDPSSGNISSMMYTITEPNSVHMLWLLPQYIIITIGEVMFSITGLEFSFAQAPVSMKSVLQAAWLLTVAFGNLIVVVVAESIKFDKQSKEFFLFAGLMFIDMIIFAVMAYFYKSANKKDDEDQKDIPMQ